MPLAGADGGLVRKLLQLAKGERPGGRGGALTPFSLYPHALRGKEGTQKIMGGPVLPKLQ